MKNMGLRQLVLVDPRKFPDPEAEWRAASALDIIQAARVVETLDEAIADSQFVVGTSARDRRIPWPVQDARLTASRIVQHSSTDKVSILFGREDSGLNNEELRRCNLHCHIPTTRTTSHLIYQWLSRSSAMRFVWLSSRVRCPKRKMRTGRMNLLLPRTWNISTSTWRKPGRSGISQPGSAAAVDDTIATALQPCSPR